ncbi:hypothetical protein MNBD_BACTEROID03-400 [hydrothermal vent metagenome]|uniref:Uncharacterized protein n=1 Tax=hydrothermal vent metagenome TaxID=652676 RepID=A0A3B0TD43_9ZZZZ
MILLNIVVSNWFFSHYFKMVLFQRIKNSSIEKSFNLNNSSTALPRACLRQAGLPEAGFPITPPLGGGRNCLFAPEASGPGGAKYKISVPDDNRDETGETSRPAGRLVPLWLALGIAFLRQAGRFQEIFYLRLFNCLIHCVFIS